MKKTYILDTSVYLSDFRSIFSYGSNNIVIPLIVLEEIDNHKKRVDSVGTNARGIIRILDSLREKGSLQTGVRVKKNSGFVLAKNFDFGVLPIGFDSSIPDHQIIATAITEQKNNPNTKVVVVSCDINMRVKCDSIGIKAEDYTPNRAIKEKSQIYTGFSTFLVDDQLIDRFYSGENIYISKQDAIKQKNRFHCNQFIMLVSSANEKKTAIARYMDENTPLRKVKESENLWGISPKNKEQSFAIDILLDPNIPVVSLIGKAGSGKSLLAVAAGLQQLMSSPLKNGNGKNGDKEKEHKYSRLIISRPVQPMGRDIGFLPGPQPLDAKILTPNGWTTMGDIEIGNYIIAKNGKPSKVIGTFPKGKKSVFEIITTDNRKTECCDDHLWYTQTSEERKRNKKGKIRSTNEIRTTLKIGDKINHSIPRNEPIQFNKQLLPIPPYVLGAILGDGSISNSIGISNIDNELIDRVRKELEMMDCILGDPGKSIFYNIKRKYQTNNKPSRKIKITNSITKEEIEFSSIGKALEKLDINRSTLQSRCDKKLIIDNFKYEFLDCENKWSNPIKEELFKLGLEGRKCNDKFIPNIYKFSSIEDRIAILQGLMDTDGTIKEKGEAGFITTSKQLALDVIELVYSLGGKSILRKREIRKENDNTKINNRIVKSNFCTYEFTISLPETINPFFISRKSNRHKAKYLHFSKIKEINYIGEKEVKCILIDDPEHLYITDDYIVTHNTVAEKMLPWLSPIQDNLRFLFSNDHLMLSQYMEKGIIEIEALTYIRGRSIQNAYIIIDECQSLTKHEMKTILTRVGNDSKIVLTGDVEQIDNVHVDDTSNGLTHVVEKFKEFDFAGHVTLTKGERSRVATIASQVL